MEKSEQPTNTGSLYTGKHMGKRVSPCTIVYGKQQRNTAVVTIPAGFQGFVVFHLKKFYSKVAG